VGIHRLCVAAATDNHPSLRVIARLGFHFEGVARHAEWCDGRWLDHAVFSLLDHEWPPARG
jgi:ribosomal-protein-serine acetyltransferase